MGYEKSCRRSRLIQAVSLTQQRDTALSIFCAGLDKFANQKCTVTRCCAYHTAEIADWRRYIATEAMKHSFRGFAAMSLTDLRAFLGSLKQNNWPTHGNGSRCRSTSIDLSVANLQTLAEEALDSCHGLCLQCVKDNNDFPGSCLIHHSK